MLIFIFLNSLSCYKYILKWDILLRQLAFIQPLVCNTYGLRSRMLGLAQMFVINWISIVTRFYIRILHLFFSPNYSIISLTDFVGVIFLFSILTILFFNTSPSDYSYYVSLLHNLKWSFKITVKQSSCVSSLRCSHTQLSEYLLLYINSIYRL